MKTWITILVLMFSIFKLNAQTEQTGLQHDSLTNDKKFYDEMMSRKEKDDFTDEIKIDCPVLGNPMATIHIVKIFRNGKVYYFMDLMTLGSTCVVDGKGVIILFTDGTKLTKSEIEIDVDVSNNDFRYTAFFPLTLNDLNSLSSKIIDKFRLYIFDGKVKSQDADDFKIYTKNLMLTK